MLGKKEILNKFHFLYKPINIILNKRRGKVTIDNNGSILIGCRVISKGTGNILRLHRGGYTEIVFLNSTEMTIMMLIV